MVGVLDVGCNRGGLRDDASLDAVVETAGRVKEYRFGDVARAVLRPTRYERLKARLHELLVEREYSTDRRQRAAGAAYGLLQGAADETPYNFCVDGLAMNIVSLPFVITDYMGVSKQATNRIAAAFARRGVAFGPNFVTGRLFGSYQDRIYHWLDTAWIIDKEPRKWIRRAKKWAASSGIFLTGQTWLYGLYHLAADRLTGEETDLESVAASMLTLTVAAGAAGPIFEAGYRKIRTTLGLPAVPEYRREGEDAAAS